MKLNRIIILSSAISLALSMPVGAAVDIMPSVSEDMLDSGYWTKDVEDADDILADADTIKRLNASYLANPDCKMNDLANEPETFDGEAANLARWKSAMTDIASYLDGKHYDEEGNVLSGKFAMSILNNLDDPNAEKEQELRYGICVHRTNVRVFPTEYIIADDPGDNDFDNVQNSGLRVGEPVTILGETEDGRYYYCHTTCVSGWILSEDIAICKDKEEWRKAWDFDSDDVMVVTTSKIMLEHSNTNPELSGLLLTMGTVLEKVHPYEYGKLIENRSTYYNHAVWIPTRDSEGMYVRKRALVSAHHDISDGYRPLTKANIVAQAYEMLGDAYGWGAMLSSADCSSFVRDVYKCFGFELPRNTTWQAAMPVLKYDISVADDEDKKELFDSLAPGAILFFKGHEMLYLGHEDDNYYVISSTSSMMYPGSDDKARIRSIVINSLEERRANGNTWLSDLYEVAVPYVENEENLMTPVFKSEEKIKADTGSNAPDNKNEEDEAAAGDLGYEEIKFDETWGYAANSKINDGVARLYRSQADARKDITVCINAGHGTKDGANFKTLCHPDGSPKIVSGSTTAGATEATAISNGVEMKDGSKEAEATLKAALVVKEELLKAGYDVLMIRETDDVQLDNIARTLIANHFADIHIAIHYDSTDTDKGVFYCSIPDNKDYKEMEPVKSHWQEHEKLGKSLVYALGRVGFAPWNKGELPMDLTQTSYSTIPSVDLEIGDTVTDRSYSTLVKVAEGITEGVNYFTSMVKPRERVDYSDENNWAYYGIGEDKAADLFLICPTVDVNDEYNMSMDDETTKESFLGALNMERGIYEDSTRMFAPYYRQAAMKVYEIDEDEREPYMLSAYQDISDAFAYYLEHENNGRPIVLAGFSQGADMCYRLLEEYFGDKKLDDRLVAVYAIGWPCSNEFADKYPQIRPAQSADDIGTVISFDCEAPDVTDTFVWPEGTDAFSINPLSWTCDSKPADKSLNPGACFTDYEGKITQEVKGLCGCYIDEERGTLKITDIEPEDFPAYLTLLPKGAYHIYDYQFFYRSLQENVKNRINIFVDAVELDEAA